MNKNDATLAGIFAVVGVIVGLGVWLMAKNEPAIKHINVPVYSDIIPGQIIKYLDVAYYEYMEGGVLTYAAAYTDNGMDVEVDGFTSLHDALNTIRQIVTSSK